MRCSISAALFVIITTFAALLSLIITNNNNNNFASASDASNNNNDNYGPSSLFSDVSEIEEITSFCQISSIIRDRYRASVIFFYDSADLNSWRMKPTIVESANLLAGFARTLAADVRNPNVTMLRAAWSVNTVPWAFGIGPKQFKPRTEDFGATGTSSLTLLTGLRTPIPRLPHFGEMNPQSIRKFGLGLVADSSLVIEHIEAQQKLKKLENAISASDQASTCSVVLLTDKSQSSLLYRALAANYARRCTFSEVNVKKLPAALKTFDASKTPHLMVFDKDGAKTVYEGQLNIIELEKFLDPLAPETRQELNKRLYSEHKSALKREVKRRESPLMSIETADDWMTEVDQRAGVVGIFIVPTTANTDKNDENNNKNNNEETNNDGGHLQRARKAVEELRAKEQKKKTRTNVVQFLAFSRQEAPALAKVEDVLAGSPLSDEDKAMKTGVYFISSRKKVATRFMGAISGDGLFGFMRSELKNGIGVKNVDMEELRKAIIIGKEE